MVLKLQQLTSLLNFISRAIVPGRTFTRRMYTKYACVGLKQHYHVNVDHELRSDYKIWVQFLDTPHAYSRPFTDFKEVLKADTLDFSRTHLAMPNQVLGCVFENTWTFGH